MFTRALEAARPPLLTRNFVSLLTAQACFGYAFSSFLLLPKFLVTELAAGPVEIGRVMGIYGVTVVISMPLMGTAVDRFGRRDFLTAGAILMAVASLAFVVVDQVGPLLYALRALQGLGFSMAFAAGAALAVDKAPPPRLGQAIGVFGLTFLAMNAVAPAVIEEVAGRAGWSAAFATAACGSLFCALLSRRLRDRRSLPAAGEELPGLWQVATRASQVRISVVVALAGAALGAMFTFHQPFALELGMTQVRSFFVSYAAVAVAVRVGLGPMMDRAGRRRVSIASLVLYVCVVTAMAKLRPGELPLFGGILGVAHGLFYPAFNAVAVEGVGVHERGKVMALFQAAFNVGFAIGALALGLLADRAGYPAVFVAGGACALVALVVLAASPEGRVTRAPSGVRSAPSRRGSLAVRRSVPGAGRASGGGERAGSPPRARCGRAADT
jgi:MFS family permease